MSVAIKVKNVSKSFNDSVILDDISIDFYENKIYGLLGKNGVGKTTLLNIITKQLISKSGTIEIFGQNINESDDVLDKLCIVREREFPENDILIKELFNTYSYFYKDYDKNLQEKLCDYFELDSKKSYRKLSRGMKSIVSNIIGICSNASITIFDEPTIGLDADNRNEFYKILLDSYIKNPRTIILSTHLINEVENLIENVVIIDKGKVIVDDSIDNISQKSFYISGDKSDLEKLKCLKNTTPDKSFGSKQVYKYYGDINEDDLKYILLKGGIQMNKLMPYFRLMKKSIILMIVITLSIAITHDGKEILTGFKHSVFENGYLIFKSEIYSTTALLIFIYGIYLSYIKFNVAINIKADRKSYIKASIITMIGMGIVFSIFTALW